MPWAPNPDLGANVKSGNCGRRKNPFTSYKTLSTLYLACSPRYLKYDVVGPIEIIRPGPRNFLGALPPCLPALFAYVCFLVESIQKRVTDQNIFLE